MLARLWINFCEQVAQRPTSITAICINWVARGEAGFTGLASFCRRIGLTRVEAGDGDEPSAKRLRLTLGGKDHVWSGKAEAWAKGLLDAEQELVDDKTELTTETLSDVAAQLNRFVDKVTCPATTRARKAPHEAPHEAPDSQT